MNAVATAYRRFFQTAIDVFRLDEVALGRTTSLLKTLIRDRYGPNGLRDTTLNSISHTQLADEIIQAEQTLRSIVQVEAQPNGIPRIIVKPYNANSTLEIDNEPVKAGKGCCGGGCCK